MTILSTVVAVSLESLSFSSFAAFSSFVSFQRHQLLFDLVQSDRRVITPSFLFLVLGSSSTSIIKVGLLSIVRFVFFTSSLLQRSHLSKQCINLHGNRLVLFPFLVKKGRFFLRLACSRMYSCVVLQCALEWTLSKSFSKSLGPKLRTINTLQLSGTFVWIFSVWKTSFSLSNAALAQLKVTCDIRHLDTTWGLEHFPNQHQHSLCAGSTIIAG